MLTKLLFIMILCHEKKKCVYINYLKRYSTILHPLQCLFGLASYWRLENHTIRRGGTTLNAFLFNFQMYVRVWNMCSVYTYIYVVGNEREGVAIVNLPESRF